MSIDVGISDVDFANTLILLKIMGETYRICSVKLKVVNDKLPRIFCAVYEPYSP